MRGSRALICRPRVRKTFTMLRLGTVVLGADDVDRAAAFWANVFGYEVVAFPGADDDFKILVPSDRSGTRIAVHRSMTVVQERPRCISISSLTALLSRCRRSTD